MIIYVKIDLEHDPT